MRNLNFYAKSSIIKEVVDIMLQKTFIWRQKREMKNQRNSLIAQGLRMLRNIVLVLSVPFVIACGIAYAIPAAKEFISVIFLCEVTIIYIVCYMVETKKFCHTKHEKNKAVVSKDEGGEVILSMPRKDP